MATYHVIVTKDGEAEPATGFGVTSETLAASSDLALGTMLKSAIDLLASK